MTDLTTLATAAGLSPANFTAKQWSQIINFGSATHTAGYNSGYGAALSAPDPALSRFTGGRL